MLPTDGAKARLGRMGLLAEALVLRGHEVVRWASTFIHNQNKQRFNKDTIINFNEKYRIHLLHSISYKKTRSLFRIINNIHISMKFLYYARNEERPDIIVCSSNNILALIATKYAYKNSIPLVLDIRDLWPDVFIDSLSLWKKYHAKLLLWPLSITVNLACKRATAITGITPAFVEWGLQKANRNRTSLDTHFPLGYSEKVPDKKDILEAENFWLRQGICKNDKKFIACFLGTMSSYFELDVIIKAAHKLNIRQMPIYFVLCGEGPKLNRFKKLAVNCDNVIFPGWVGFPEILTLMRMSSVGLTPYKSISNFINNLPNKPAEYMSAGLPIVSSLKGELQKLLSNYDCGVTYENGNIDELVSILCELYNNPNRLKSMSKNAYALYKEKFVAEKIYNEMSSYLEKVAETDIN